jgi:hypothetical protein
LTSLKNNKKKKNSRLKMTKLTLNQSQIFLLSQGNSNNLIVYLKLRRKKILIYAMPKKYNDKATMVVKDDNVNAQ